MSCCGGVVISRDCVERDEDLNRLCMSMSPMVFGFSVTYKYRAWWNYFFRIFISLKCIYYVFIMYYMLEEFMTSLSVTFNRKLLRTVNELFTVQVPVVDVAMFQRKESSSK